MNSKSDRKIFYGWYIVAAAFAANFLTVGTGFYILNAFMEPLCNANGWTRTQVNMALVMGMLFGYAAQMIYGVMVSKVGPRIMMFIGPFFAGGLFMLLGRVDVLWQFYLIFVLLFFANGAYGGIVANTAVSNWFVLKRGKAMGIATSAISLSGAVMPLAAMAMILKIGIQDTSFWIGLVVIGMGPASWLVVRNWPEDHGMKPDGAVYDDGCDSLESVCDAEEDEANEAIWTLKDLAASPAFWKTGFAYAMVMTGVVGVMSQLKPRFADLGLAPMHAMYLMAGTALVGAGGKYFWGMLCDRYEPKNVAAIMMAANGLGLCLGLVKSWPGAIYLFAVLFGFAMGGVMSTYPILTAHLFGRRSFAAALKYMMLFLILQLGGPVAAGQSFDRTGSYDLAYLLFAALAIGAAWLIFTVKRPSPPKAS